tara:strand:+ start:845 stop:1084 length:240 start_codon:yes stop_codon:yes gene_type:complete
MDGLIRKIVVGRDPKEAMAYFVGMRAGGGKVSAILHDDRHLVKYGKNRYLVYMQDDEGAQTLWKSIDSMPCMLEFDCNF